MKRAIVLSGGGAKGAYEMGVWKALRKLGITYDIVTGTSIGGLNAAMMVQKDYYKCLKVWYYMNYDYVSSMEINGKYNTKKGRKEIITKYTKGMLKGGYDMDGLSKIIDSTIDTDLFFKSNIDYGLVTTYFPSLKGKYVTKKDMNKDTLKKYLLATASCFPAFKPTKIGNNNFIDGGYTDNLPIKMAIDMGADEIIAVDLKAIGITKKNKYKDIPITYIRPKKKLGSMLVFEKNYTRNYIKLGYNDAMKEYKKLDGNLYTFKKDSLKRNYDRNIIKLNNIIDIYKKYFDNPSLKKMMKEGDNNYYINVIETIMESFDIDPSEVYRVSYINVLIRNKFNAIEYKKYNSLRKVSVKQIKSNNISKELIAFMYNIISSDSRYIKRYINMFPKAFMCAIYIKMLERR